MRFTLFLTLLALVVGCTKDRDQSAPHSPTHHEFHSETARHFNAFGERDTETAASRNYEVERYFLDGRFDWSTETFHAETTIDLRLTDDKTNVLELDSLVTKVHFVKLASGAALAFETPPGKLRVTLSGHEQDGVISLVVGYETHANTGVEKALISTPHRKGDPVPGRTVATFSEPIGTPEWMPCNNVPSDRALFSSRFTVPADERAIANGELVSDEVKDGVRTVAYQTAYTLPTYLMAFAMGHFDVATDHGGRVPLQIWHRPGLAVDTTGMLKELRRFMEVFEGLLVPYPFEKYALVLLPAYTSGLEHAGITFQGESRSSHAQVAHDLELSAHELAHQWFGDLVTVATWDDLWIKEGMATLLAQEALRPYEDENKSGRLLVKDFSIKSGEAVRDPALHPNDKYTSGPYGRGAWVYSQIRSLMGEKAFWSTLVGVLNKYKFGSIGTEELLAEFKEPLGEETIDRIRKALVAKALPAFETLAVTKEKLSFKLADKDGALIAPLTMQYLTADGGVTDYAVAGQAAVEIPLSEGGLLLFDLPDRHPWFDFLSRDDAANLLAPLVIPQTAPAKETFLSLAAHHQQDALALRKTWSLSPATFEKFYSQMNSELGRYRALQLACDLGKESATAEWKAALEPLLKNPPMLGLPDPTSGEGLSSCRDVLGDETFAEAWSKIVSNAAGEGHEEPQLLFLTLISASADKAFEYAKALVTSGATVRTQRMMTELMGRHWEGKGKYEKPKEAAAWTAYLRELITTNQVEETLDEALDILADAKDKEALPTLAKLVPSAHSPNLQKEFFCAAFKITANGKAGWPVFVKDLGDPVSLSPGIRALIADPKPCLRVDEY